MAETERNSYVRLRDDEKADLEEAQQQEFGGGRAISQGAFVALLARRALDLDDEPEDTTEEENSASLIV